MPEAPLLRRTSLIIITAGVTGPRRHCYTSLIIEQQGAPLTLRSIRSKCLAWMMQSWRKGAWLVEKGCMAHVWCIHGWRS